ncbi:MAG: SH3 domain-containing protein [Anaerolineae bacterium]|nr:SH3 domain-containing protein [Anaerolineae bacterium]
MALLLLPAAVLAQQPTPIPAPAQPTPIPALSTGGTGSAQPALGPITIPTLSALPTAMLPPGSQALATPAAPGDSSAPAGGVLQQPASSTDLCPALVQDAYNATALTCPTLASGEACLGNGVIEASPRADLPDFQFELPGNKARLADLSELRLRTLDTESRAWTVVTAQFPLSSTDAASPPLNTAFVMVGDVTIADDGQLFSAGARSATVLATSGINVRRTPDTSGVVVWQLTPSEQVTVTGRSRDQQWIRIEIPGRFGGIGWVYAPYLDVTGGAETLPFVSADSPRPDLSPPEFGPMQAISLLSAVTAATCTNTPDSGILVQSPSGIALEAGVRLRVNDAVITLNGTAFIQAQAGAALLVSVLEGEARLTVGETTISGTTGSRLSVTMSANLEPQGEPAVSPADAARLAALPITLLPREFALVAAPAAGSDSAPATEGTVGGISTAPIAATPQPTAEPCLLTAADTVRNIRSGAGTNFEVVALLQPGETIAASAAVAEGPFLWYQTERGFIRFDTVQASAGCGALTGAPVAAPALPAAATIAPTGTAAPALSIVSSESGELCGAAAATGSFLFPDGVEAAAVGGTWTASAGATLVLEVGGGIIFRGEFGDYTRLADGSGNLLARSGENRTLTYTFDVPTTFQLQIIASKGDFVVYSINCR